MSEWVEQHIPCPCGKSSDAFSVNSKGWGTCFSCGDEFAPDKIETGEPSKAPDTKPSKKPKRPLVEDLEFRPLKSRKISQATCEKYGYAYGDYSGKSVQVSPYHDENGRVVAQKLRFKDKGFTVTGSMPGTLFGQHLFRNKGGRRLVITEGEIDAMTIYDVMSSRYVWPCVSIPQGVHGAVKALKDNIEFIESFEEVLLCFDMDEPGQEAIAKVTDLITPGKVKVVTLPLKDANECVVQGRADELIKAIWEAKVKRPDGVVNASELRDKVNERVPMGRSYPWGDLNKLTYGQHRGRLVTWTAGSGLGKSAFVREVAYHLGVHLGCKVGYIGLEENVAYTATTFVGLHLSKPIHLPNVEADPFEIDRAFDETLGSGNFWFYDHFGSIEEDGLFSKLRYMAACGCEFIVLDHLTIVLSGLEVENERLAIDRTMTKLRSFCEQTGVGIHLVSHLRRPMGKGHEDGAKPSLAELRGSHAIVQLSDFIIALQRNSSSADPTERNTSKLWVLKNRLSGETGLGAVLRYDGKTGRLRSVGWVVDENGEVIIDPDEQSEMEDLIDDDEEGDF